MIRILIGFVLGAGLVLGLVFFRVITPGSVRTATHDPGQGVRQVTDNVVRQVREGVKNLRTEAEAAAMVQGKTGQPAVCRREGLSNRHVCRCQNGKIFRVMGDDVILFKGDLKTLDPALATWAKKTFADLLGSAQPASPPVAAPQQAAPKAPLAKGGKD